MAIAILGNSADAKLIYTLLVEIGTAAEIWRCGMDLLDYLRSQPTLIQRYQLFLLDSDQIPLAAVLTHWFSVPIFFFQQFIKANNNQQQMDNILANLLDYEVVEYQGPDKKPH